MKNIYLIHCWDGTANDGWYPWLEEQIKSPNINFYRLAMPNTATPKIEEWVNKITAEVKSLDENTYFIGHSIGCQAIMRFLENKSNKIGGCLFVAPWLELLPAAIADKESYNIALPWLKTPINFANIKQLTNNIHCLFSDNDYWVAQDQAELFANKLKANIYCVSNKGHISQEDGVYELPEILTITKLIINK